MTLNEFPIQIGETVVRSDLHTLIGGTPQSGMSSCLGGQAFLLFHNPKVSKKFGYDLWEGLQADGTFWYTGQGKLGDQTLTRSNLKLLQSADEGKPIHLFVSKSGRSTYQGLVNLALDKYEWKFAPDQNNRTRKVIIFKLLPLYDNLLLRELQGIDLTITSKRIDFPKSNESSDKSPNLKTIHFTFENYAKKQGLKLSVEHLWIENRKGSISLDYCNSEAKIIYQVIESIDYETIARAIGRILMYRSLVESINAEYSYKIVVPQFPNSRIVQLCRELKIELVDLSKELIKK